MPDPAGSLAEKVQADAGFALFLNLRHVPRPINTPAKIASATFSGSGTAVMSRLQLTKVVSSPGLLSAKKSVHVLFGLSELKLARFTEKSVLPGVRYEDKSTDGEDIR